MNKQNAIERIKFPEKLGFFTFAAASNVVFSFKDLFYLFFLTNIMGISMAHAGVITVIGIVWDAINDPLLGFWSVNHRFKNGEQCRPFALWCAVPWAVTTVLMFTSFDVAYGLKIGIAISVYFLFELFNTFVAIPYNSMGALATNLDADRRSINVVRNFGGCVGSTIGSVALYPMLSLFGGLDEDGNIIAGALGKHAFFMVAMVMGAVCVVGSFAHYFTTKERVKQVSEDNSKISALDAAKMLLGSRSWVFNTLYVLCYGVMNLLIMSSTNYYATYVLGSSAAATPVLAVVLVMSMIASFFISPVDRALGRRNTMVLSCVIYILGKIWFVLSPRSMAAFYVNGVSLGISMAFAFVLFSTNRNNICDLVEWKNGRRIDSLVSTGDNLISKLAKAGGNLLLTGVLASTGFSTDLPTQTDATINAIIAFLGWVPMILAVVMLVVAIFNPIQREMAQMNSEKA